MIIILSIVVITLAIALIILARGTRSIFKSQLVILQADNVLNKIRNLKVKVLEEEIENLKKSIEWTDAGVSIIYNSYKELDEKFDTITGKNWKLNPKLKGDYGKSLNNARKNKKS